MDRPEETAGRKCLRAIATAIGVEVSIHPLRGRAERDTSVGEPAVTVPVISRVTEFYPISLCPVRYWNHSPRLGSRRVRRPTKALHRVHRASASVFFACPIFIRYLFTTFSIRNENFFARLVRDSNLYSGRSAHRFRRFDDRSPPISNSVRRCFRSLLFTSYILARTAVRSQKTVSIGINGTVH